MPTAARQPNAITREGYTRLRAELDYLVRIRRRQMADDLREAREDGAEPGENVGVAAVLDDQAALERRIAELEAALSLVQIVDAPTDGVAGIGHRIRVRFGEGGAPIVYELVGPLEADSAQRRISIDSPVGQALVGQRAGDVVEVEAPRGVRIIEILSVGDCA